MPRILYFDSFNGVSGDMVLGALLDLGMPLDHLRREMARLSIEGYTLRAETIERQGLRGINFQVLTSRPDSPGASADIGHEHTHAHSHGQAHDHDHLSGKDHSAGGSHHHEHHEGRHRSLGEILSLITSSDLSPRVRERACRIFQRLGQAEAKVHNSPIDEVHFHEVGAVDAIVDIVGACIGFDYFEIDHFYTAPLNLGGGTVTFSHGTWPVPAPATAELVRGFDCRLGSCESELTTPTGAAIVTTLALPGVPPTATYSRWGLGAGDRQLPEIPNMLRLMLGETSATGLQAGMEGVESDHVTVFEAAVDDMDPQVFGHFMDLAFAEGALDVYYTPAQMKKNRPGILLTLLCRPEDQARMAGLLFRETSTLGVRVAVSQRWTLARETREVVTNYGPIRVKLGRLGGRIVNVWPEFDDLRKAAEKNGQPLKMIRQDVLREIGKFEDYE